MSSLHITALACCNATARLEARLRHGWALTLGSRYPSAAHTSLTALGELPTRDAAEQISDLVCVFVYHTVHPNAYDGVQRSSLEGLENGIEASFQQLACIRSSGLASFFSCSSESSVDIALPRDARRHHCMKSCPVSVCQTTRSDGASRWGDN